MKKIAMLGALLLSSASFAGTVEQVWESDVVLKGPESVLYDQASDYLYVSNVNGNPNEKNGLGFISRMTKDGKVDTLTWSEGLDAPKGMAIVDKHLYVADLDKVVKIELATGNVVMSFAAEGAQFLNDVTADCEGRVYITDMVANRIYRIEEGALSLWLESADLQNPNGIQALGDTLYLGTWGVMTNGFETEVPGRMKLINIKDKSITDYAGTPSIGNLDGVVILDDGKEVLLSDWMAGGLLTVTPDGTVTQLIDLDKGSADLGWNPSNRHIYVPMMLDNKVVSYHLKNK